MVQALRKEGCNLSKFGHIIEEAWGIKWIMSMESFSCPANCQWGCPQAAKEAFILSEERFWS